MEKKITCQYCNKVVTKIGKPSDFERGHRSRSFCSPVCRNKARTLVDIPCPICGTMFKPKRINGTGKPRQKYCSPQCGWKASVGRPGYCPKGIPSPRKTPKHIIDKIREIYPAHGAEPLIQLLDMTKKAIQMVAYKNGIRLDDRVYCARVHESARKYMKTTKNPGYRTGATCNKWGDNWYEQRKATLRRDHSICQVCRKPGYSVHHIKPRRLFVSHIEDANVLSNLITLCASCHKYVENGQLPCPIPR